MDSKRDFYEVLAVERDADQKTIKRAFLKLARKLHPDVNDAPDAEEKFKEVNEAYSVLSDERKRANYDRYGDPDGSAGFGGGSVDMSDFFGGGFGINDIFDSFFGGMGSQRGGASVRTHGRDMGIRLQITLEEAAAGCTKTISYTRLAPCDDCGGTGVAEGGSVRTCDRCHGSGVVIEIQRTIFGQMQSQTTCPTCQGEGTIIKNKCHECHGEGIVKGEEVVEINIPAGVAEGMVVNVPGKGNAGKHNGVNGNIQVFIEEEKNDTFVRDGQDVIYNLLLDFPTAALGGQVDIPTIDGQKVKIKIEPGTQPGKTLRLRGKGIPAVKGYGGGMGDLVVNISVYVPKTLSREEKEMLEKMQQSDNFKGDNQTRKSIFERFRNYFS